VLEAVFAAIGTTNRWFVDLRAARVFLTVTVC
jgi:hypothetical protein